MCKSYKRQNLAALQEEVEKKDQVQEYWTTLVQQYETEASELKNMIAELESSIDELQSRLRKVGASLEENQSVLTTTTQAKADLESQLVAQLSSCST
ncbi:hypothetical protein BOTNAR_0002g00390 [Botryotinia narcissicola]|uniref:Uncharacterized protein n=1 Tax=Botryotinia narcissicola TaxID=278944 RepID=A0A4Z1J959_9HELO|nr:hypothetical protein BOTNAR_0002g00390 [Botryotinia narcissicola]